MPPLQEVKIDWTRNGPIDAHYVLGDMDEVAT